MTSSTQNVPCPAGKYNDGKQLCALEGGYLASVVFRAYPSAVNLQSRLVPWWRDVLGQ